MAPSSAQRAWPWGRGTARRTSRRNEGASTGIDEWTALVCGHVFVDRDVLDLSRAHRSWCAERGGRASNERLEFLGDAVLQWIVTEWLFTSHPELEEGGLTELRKSLVNTEILARMARQIGLGEWLLLGVGERAAGGSDKSSILADALEAFIGALYLDAGIDTTRRFLIDVLDEARRSGANRLDDFDSRSHLIRVCVREFARPPRVDISSRGAAHEPTFTAQVVIDGEIVARAEGRSKKVAAQAASAQALSILASRGIDIGRA